MAAMPTKEDVKSLGRARMIRHIQGGRRVLRLRVGISVSGDRSIVDGAENRGRTAGAGAASPGGSGSACYSSVDTHA
jgi:hypothetical protein